MRQLQENEMRSETESKEVDQLKILTGPLTRRSHIVRVDVALVADDHDQYHDDSKNETGNACRQQWARTQKQSVVQIELGVWQPVCVNKDRNGLGWGTLMKNINNRLITNWRRSQRERPESRQLLLGTGSKPDYRWPCIAERRTCPDCQGLPVWTIWRLFWWRKTE